MRHKAQAIFDYMNRFFMNRNLSDKHHEIILEKNRPWRGDYLYCNDNRFVVYVHPTYDTFDDNKLAYVEVSILDNERDILAPMTFPTLLAAISTATGADMLISTKVFKLDDDGNPTDEIIPNGDVEIYSKPYCEMVELAMAASKLHGKVIPLMVRDPLTMKFSINSAGGMFVSDAFDVKGEKYPQERFVNQILQMLQLNHNLTNLISVKEVASIPAGKNPYNFDAWRQGVGIGKYWEVMFTSAGEGNIENVRLVCSKNGRVFDLDLYDAEKPLPMVENETKQ